MAKHRPSLPPDRLEKAALRLRPIEREALYLAACEHLAIGEIATRLGLTEQAVARLLARALCKLDRALKRRERPWWRYW